MFHEDYENLVDVLVHDVFDNKKQLQNWLHFMMMRTKYQFKVHKSSPSLLVVHCMDNNCGWRVRGMRFERVHTCVVDYKREGHRQATSGVIGDCLKNRYIYALTFCKPKDIMDDVRETFGVEISYGKAWRAREAAYDTLRGTSEESYTFLPSFLHVLGENNPDSFSDLM
ncbi:hypothetical protein UlMin_002209 [Ulmus minor]